MGSYYKQIIRKPFHRQHFQMQSTINFWCVIVHRVFGEAIERALKNPTNRNGFRLVHFPPWILRNIGNMRT